MELDYVLPALRLDMDVVLAENQHKMKKPLAKKQKAWYNTSCRVTYADRVFNAIHPGCLMPFSRLHNAIHPQVICSAQNIINHTKRGMQARNWDSSGLTGMISVESLNSLMHKHFTAPIGKSTRPNEVHFWGGLPYTLGERLNGIQEVSGSIPLFSTIAGLSEPDADRRRVRIYLVFQ